MSRPPKISGRKFGKFLEKNGWVYKRTKGSHAVYTKKGFLYNCSVPLHPELAIGTLSSLLKKAEISMNDFIKKMKKK